jgi:hypothetical protein
MKTELGGKMPTSKRILKYFGLAMPLLYVLAGILVLSGSATAIPTDYVLTIGIALLGYGLFRGYRIRQKHFQK